MEQLKFAGALIRMMRLEKNWSQETLCEGICAVSYLSKIEQGKVYPNEALLGDIFAKLGIRWEPDHKGEGRLLCESVYDAIFCGNRKQLRQKEELLAENWERLAAGPSYMDFVTLKAYCAKDLSSIPQQFYALMDDRQSSLIHVLQSNPEEAWRRYPCAFTAMSVGIQTYHAGNYTLALEYLQRAYDLACQQGYAHLMMDCQIFIANCYSNLRNLDAMQKHCQVAKRLAHALNEEDRERSIDYNMASTQMECGHLAESYAFFSSLQDPSVMELHKLAICCEKLGSREEASAALRTAEDRASGIEAKMCSLVRYRLNDPDYLSDPAYGKLLMDTFDTLRKERPLGFARFHLPWVEEWCKANRQYRLAFEIFRDFT